METKDMPMKKITMQIKPHLLYAPSLSKMTSKAPDYNANFHLFDRVIVARETEKYSVGMRGTVIGINKVKDLNPVRQDCINREDTYCEVLFDDQKGNNKTGRIIAENLVNISYGETLSGSERVVTQPEKITNGNKQTDEQPPTVINYSAVLKNDKSGPQKNQNFTDIWNALKQGVGSTSSSQPVTSTPRNSLPLDENQTIDAKTAICSQKKLNEALNEKMAELNTGKPKKKSPVPNDQSVPIMISPPAKLPTPPPEWLSNTESVSEPKIFPDPRPRTKLEMPPQGPQGFSNNNFVRGQVRLPNSVPQIGFQHPIPFVPMFPQRVRMVQPMPLVSAPIVMQPQPQQVGPFFANNQQPRQQQQRYFNNSSYNNNKQQLQAKYRPNQSMPLSAPVQSNSQQNPFIPLQAARKYTKGKDMPGNTQQTAAKEVVQKVKEIIKTEELSTSQTVKEPSPPVETETKKTSQPAQKTNDPRKSRLAIKF